MKFIDLDGSKDTDLITLNELFDENLNLDIWGYHNQSCSIDITLADNQEVIIEELEIKSNNVIKLGFVAKKYLIKIKNLTLKTKGIDYLGGAIVENLTILTNQAFINFTTPVANNIIIKQVPNEDVEAIRSLLQAVEIIPGSGEYVLDPDFSYHQRAGSSLTELKQNLPNVKWIAPVAAWFATSLDIKSCKILPGVDGQSASSGWQVGNYTQETAHKISYEGPDINYGGSINDESVLKYLTLAKTQGLNILFYPLIMVDIKDKPWRGHINGQPEDVELFFKQEYEPFIIHYANLVKGKVDAFIIGSELVKLTRIATVEKNFLFVNCLVELALKVKNILGTGVKITYATDWSEYHTADGVERPLDKLWACNGIDFVGIDAYFPLTHKQISRATIEEIKLGWGSGEGYEYYFQGSEKINYQSDEPWNQWKNLEYWWNSEHWVGGQKTAWQPKMKPIWFTEFGFPSIDKATNKPNVFYDPKSSDGGIPTYSSGKIDYAIQLKGLRATLEFWQNSSFLENMFCWTWDARGINWRFLKYKDKSEVLRPYYADGDLWEYGHWIDGKVEQPHKLTVSGKLIANSLIIEADEVAIRDAKIDLSGRLTIDTPGNLSILSKVTGLQQKQRGKGFGLAIESVYSETELIDPVVIKSTSCTFKVGQNLEIHAALIKSGLLYIESSGLLIMYAKFDIARSFVTNVNGDVNITSRIVTDCNSFSHGSKDQQFHRTQEVDNTRIKASMFSLLTSGNCKMEGTLIETNKLKIIVSNMDFIPVITTNTYITEFTGEEKWHGGSEDWTVTKIEQKATPVIINTNIIDIKVLNMFAAEGSKINAIECQIEAKDYHFKGVNLEHSHSHDTNKDWVVGSKSTYSNQGGVNIVGVSVIIKGQAYIFAENKIWLQGSIIDGEDLQILAKGGVLLEGLVGSQFHDMKVNKSGYRLTLTFGSGEASIGSELYKERQKMNYYSEHLVPSGIIGRNNLFIDTSIIWQKGSVIAGGNAKIKAEDWKASTIPLTQRIETRV